MKDEKKFGRFWFWVPTISYIIAVVTCFICNLSVSHELSWFYIVLASILCAYTFVPTITSFFKKNKLLAFSISTCLSICVLLLTCALYAGDVSWVLTACTGTLIGYALVFIPILLVKTKLSNYKFVISFVVALILTVLLLVSIHVFHPFMLEPAIWLTCYAFVPVILCAGICMLRLDGFLKAGICTWISVAGYYFLGYVINFLFGINENYYEVDFYNWEQCLTGNVHFICLTSIAVIGAFFIEIGVIRITKKDYGEKDNEV